MNNTVKGIIAVIIAANVIYFLFGGMSGNSGAGPDCEEAMAEFDINEYQLDCDFFCEEARALNERSGSGPPDPGKVRALNTLGQCIEARTGNACNCPEEDG